MIIVHDQVEMNDVVTGLRGEIQAKSDKISQCEMQLVCMEREVGNLTNMLKSSLNNLDEAKIAYEGICEHTKCGHETCLDVQSALSALKAFIAELEECKLERRNRPRKIDNLKACVACYSQECASEIANANFDTGRGSIQPAAGIIPRRVRQNNNNARDGLGQRRGRSKYNIYIHTYRLIHQNCALIDTQFDGTN